MKHAIECKNKYREKLYKWNDPEIMSCINEFHIVGTVYIYEKWKIYISNPQKHLNLLTINNWIEKKLKRL